MVSLLKYSGLLSLPLFALLATVLMSHAPGHAVRTHSISKTILFLHHPTLRFLFRLNFILKSFVDFIFLWYIAKFFQLSWESPIIWCLGVACVLFASLAYFIEGKHAFWHVLLVYGVGVLWAITEVLLAYHIGVQWFIQYTWVSAIIPTVIAFWYLYVKKVTVVVQVVCIIMIYSWLVVFVTNFL